MKALLMAVLAATATTAQADLNKCTINGRVTYQDAPCPAQATRATLKVTPHVPDHAAINRINADVENYKWREAVDQAIRQGKVMPGMTGDEARTSWGEPTKINATVSAAGRSEQWVFRRGGGRTQYVYVENGMVTTVQDH